MTPTKSLNLSSILLQFSVGAGLVLALGLVRHSSLEDGWTAGSWLVLAGACLLGGAGALFLASQLKSQSAQPPSGADESSAGVCFWVTLASASLGAVLLASAWIGDLYHQEPRLDSCYSGAAVRNAVR